MAGSLLHEASARAGVPWFIAATCLPLGFLFLLGAAAGPGPWWEWVCGVAFAAIFVVDVVLLARHIVRADRRRRELRELTEEWQERALRGGVPLTDSSSPFDADRIRRRIEAIRSVPPPRPRKLSSMRLMTISVCVTGLGPLCLFAGLTATALRAPATVLWAFVILMPVCGAVGFAIGMASRWVDRSEHRELEDRYRRRSGDAGPERR